MSADSMYAEAAGSGGAGFSTAGSDELDAPLGGGGRSAASMPACDPANDVKAALALVTGSKLNMLLIFCPIGLAAEPIGMSASLVFFCNFLAIVPLAKILGDATEELAVHVGQTLGGLLNATFGNAVEMIMAVFALQEGLIEVVQGTLLGSILSNLLLVLGCCFFCGGISRKEQTFNCQAAQVNSSLLLVASMALILPTCFSLVGQNDCVKQEANITFTKESPTVGPADELLCPETSLPCTALQVQQAWESQCFGLTQHKTVRVSQMTSVFLFAMYIQYVYFQLVSHKDLFEGGDEEEEDVTLTKGGSMGLLAVATLLVAANSEGLVGSLDEMSTEVGLGKHFVGIVMLPIVGNAAEHVTAVSSAMKDKMNLALGVAVGSSTQIALCVVPFTVLVGIVVCPEDSPMTLDFHTFASAVLVMSVLIVNVAIADGSSNWLEGSLLV